MHRTIGIALIVGFATYLTTHPASAESQKIPKIVISDMTKQQYLKMVNEGFDIIRTQGQEIDLLAHPGDQAKLDGLGINYTIAEPDMVTYYQLRSTQAFGGFRTYTQIVALLDSFSTAYPNICSPKFSIGQTLEGRDQWVVRLSNNPGVEQGKPSVFYNALIHAREPEGADMLLNFMRYLLTHYGSDTTVTAIINTRELYFLPVTNPDGYVYNESTNPGGGGLWRKNRRPLAAGQYGIDLNRNFGFTWGYDDNGSSSNPASEVYRGSGPFSEPETVNLKNFIDSHRFTITHNIHTYSNLVLWPWGHDRIYTDQDDFYTVLGDSLTQVNHYTPEVSWTLYPTNGDADDWMWGDTISKPRGVTLTTEIGNDNDGFWPAPSRIPVLDSENLAAELFLARIADNPYVLAPPNKPVIHLADSVGQSFALSWSHKDSVNPAVGYALYELTNKQTVTDSAEIDRGYWDTARMSLSTARKHSGNSSWHSLNTNNAQHWLVSKTPYLVKPSDSLKFWIWYSVEQDYDYFYAQVSTDGGFSFTNLANNLTTNSNPNHVNLGNGITGNSGNWVRAAFDLSPYAGKQVILRLTLFTDSYTLGEGVYIDDIENVDVYGSSTPIASGIIDTTYQFSNKAVGNYWYELTATDAQGQVSRFSDLVPTTVYQSYIVGDLNGDTRIDIGDLSFLVSFLTNGEPIPSPMNRANLNCTGIVDLADLTYIVAYLTGTASAPHCP